MAAAFHRAGRSTLAIDLVIDPTAAPLRALVEALEGSGVYVSADAADEALSHRSMFNVVDTTSGWKLGGSARQLEDVAALQRIRAGPLDRAYLERWIADLGLAAQWEQVTRTVRT